VRPGGAPAAAATLRHRAAPPGRSSSLALTAPARSTDYARPVGDLSSGGLGSGAGGGGTGATGTHARREVKDAPRHTPNEVGEVGTRTHAAVAASAGQPAFHSAVDMGVSGSGDGILNAADVDGQDGHRGVYGTRPKGKGLPGKGVPGKGGGAPRRPSSR
jgi:hypothetical protein